MQRAFVLIYSA